MILSWNCRGLGGPSTISQLKEFIRLNFLDLIFICETKQKTSFIKTVCKNLKYSKRWDVVEPVGKKKEDCRWHRVKRFRSSK